MLHYFQCKDDPGFKKGAKFLRSYEFSIVLSLLDRRHLFDTDRIFCKTDAESAYRILMKMQSPNPHLIYREKFSCHGEEWEFSPNECVLLHKHLSAVPTDDIQRFLSSHAFHGRFVTGEEFQPVVQDLADFCLHASQNGGMKHIYFRKVQKIKQYFDELGVTAFVL